MHGLASWFSIGPLFHNRSSTLMRRGLVAANWKMNGLKADVDALLQRLTAALQREEGNCDVAICPPFVHLEQARTLLAGSTIQLGAQNAYIHERGAYTGEISPRMLVEFDCAYVIVGHSERRELFRESNELVAEKFAAVQLQGLTPILCLGESLEQRKAGVAETVIMEQLAAVLGRNGHHAFEQAVVAYEPVWAIGTGLTATPEEAQEMHAMIRGRLASLSKQVAAAVRVIYGGSVKASNAAELFSKPDVDGALVGGASLKAEEFAAICTSMQGLSLRAGNGEGPGSGGDSGKNVAGKIE